MTEKLGKTTVLALLAAFISIRAGAQTTDSLVSAESVKLLDSSEFRYADTHLFTITGDLPQDETRIKPLTASIAAASLGVGFYLQHEGQLSSIWNECKTDFFIREDGAYALEADKAGHFFGTYFTAYLMREIAVVSGLDWDWSNVAGGLLGLAYTTYVEVNDGLCSNWGFSPSDFYADVAGSAFFIGQHYIPFLQNITPKFMYIPADWHGELLRQPEEGFPADYSSHTLWASVNVYNLLPDNLKRYWLPWLEISFGYAARNLCHPGYQNENGCDASRSEPVCDQAWGNRVFVVALDYNLVKLLPEGGSFWNWFRQSLNYVKMPSPAVEFGPTTKLYLAYPFHI